MAEHESPIAADQLFAAALSSPLPRFYLNGFLFGQSFSDIAMIAQMNGSPAAVINMSFTTAKTLARDLASLIEKFEQAADHEIMTMHDVQARVANSAVQPK